MHFLFAIDGALFVLIGLVVLWTPSPQPALVRPVDDVALGPFKDTRRLLASQFIGNGLLALALGLTAAGAASERAAAGARIATIVIVLAINAGQLARGEWRRAPLYVVTGALAAIAVAYIVLLLQ